MHDIWQQQASIGWGELNVSEGFIKVFVAVPMMGILLKGVRVDEQPGWF